MRRSGTTRKRCRRRGVIQRAVLDIGSTRIHGRTVTDSQSSSFIPLVRWLVWLVCPSRESYQDDALTSCDILPDRSPGLWHQAVRRGLIFQLPRRFDARPTAHAVAVVDDDSHGIAVKVSKKTVIAAHGGHWGRFVSWSLVTALILRAEANRSRSWYQWAGGCPRRWVV